MKTMTSYQKKVTTCVAALCLATFTVNAAGKGKPGGGGGGGGGSETLPLCVLFDDMATDSVQSDVGDTESPYCHDPKAKVTVFIDGDFCPLLVPSLGSDDEVQRSPDAGRDGKGGETSAGGRASFGGAPGSVIIKFYIILVFY